MAYEHKVRIHVDREADGRFIAEIEEIPGILAYGQSEKGAVMKAALLYLEVVMERLSKGEEGLVDDLFAVTSD
jgi:predicted RNase H-like HicB family nuclease